MNDTTTRDGALKTAYALGMVHHEAIAALRWFAAYMRENAAGAQASYDQISADPAAKARQDQTMMTTNGLGHSARMFREAADRADEAMGAFLELADDPDELAWFDQRHGYVLTNALMVRSEHLREEAGTAGAADADRADIARRGYETLTGDDEDDLDDEPLDAGFQE